LTPEEQAPAPEPTLDTSRYDWEAPASDPKSKHFAPLAGASNRYYAEGTQLRQSHDELGAAFLELLGDVCSFRLKSDSIHRPFEPFGSLGTSRSAAIEDLTPEQLQLLRDISSTVSHQELRARINDIVWVTLRDQKAARVAIGAYLDVADPLRSNAEHWPPLLASVERAARIELQLGDFKGDGPVLKFINSLVDTYKDDGGGFLLAKLFRLMVDTNTGDPAQFLSVCERIANRAEQDSEWDRARAYWDLAAQWASRGKLADSALEAKRRMAEAFVLQAAVTSNIPSAMMLVPASHIQSAITLLRTISGQKQRVQELHALLLEYQSKGRDQMITHTSSADITEFVEAARTAVAGKPLLESFLLLGFRPALPSVTRLKQQAIDDSEKYLFARFFPKHYLSATGKTIAVPGSTHSSDPGEREGALRAEMIERCRFHFQLISASDVWPMTMVICREHPLRIDDFIELLENNVLIPSNRVGLWAEGLRAGFFGDFVKAVHVLVPQLEHALRVLLANSGLIVSGLDKDGIQQELNLNKLLYGPHGAKLTEVLGEDFVFTMQALFVEKAGADVRNRMVHGLMDEGEFYGATSICSWWLILRLALLAPRAASILAVDPPSQTPAPANEEGEP
jgi:hypothetical protein